MLKWLTPLLTLLLLTVHPVVAQGDVPLLPMITIENASASAVAWSPDGTILAVGDDDGVKLYTDEPKFSASWNNQPTRWKP